MQYNLKFDGSAAASVDDYLEYKRIVGDDDGGNLLTPEEFEAYKKRVAPMRTENRLYVSWTNSQGLDCKLIGPETECLCSHRYRQHKTDFESIPEERPIRQKCLVPRCKCNTYSYVPRVGSQFVKCTTCKHAADEHGVKTPHKCEKAGCSCGKFHSTALCACGETAAAHRLLTETRAERAARGHPVGRDTLYQAMGGITGFSSLADGYARLDPSGAGALPEEVLNQPITAADHPFLRDNARSIAAQQKALGAPGADVDADLAERMSAVKRPGESDMDFYERRYQERLKAEKEAARARRLAVTNASRAGGSRTASKDGTGAGVKGSGAKIGLKSRAPMK